MTATDLAALLNRYAGEIIATILSPILLGLVGYWKLKRLGVNRSNIAEIEDRAKFRQSLLDRITQVEAELKNSHARELQLMQQNNLQAHQIGQLQGENDALREDVRELKEKRREDKQRIRELEEKTKGMRLP